MPMLDNLQSLRTISRGLSYDQLNTMSAPNSGLLKSGLIKSPTKPSLLRKPTLGSNIFD